MKIPNFFKCSDDPGDGQGNDQGNVALIGVVTFAVVLAVLMMNFQAYLDFQIRLKARSREAVRLMDAMESAAKIARDWYDTNPQPCLQASGCQPPVAPATASCLAACRTLYGNPSTSPNVDPNICVDNPDNSAYPYCFYSWDGEYSRGEVPRKLWFEVPPGMLEAPSRMDRAYAWLDRHVFKRDPLSLNLGGTVAFAAPALPQRTDLVPLPPACPGPGCQSCGNGMAPPSGLACVTIYACPRTYKNCGTYSSSSAVTAALFTQTYFMIPSGYSN